MSHASADGAVLESQRKQGPTPHPFLCKCSLYRSSTSTLHRSSFWASSKTVRCSAFGRPAVKQTHLGQSGTGICRQLFATQACRPVGTGLRRSTRTNEPIGRKTCVSVTYYQMIIH